MIKSSINTTPLSWPLRGKLVTFLFHLLFIGNTSSQNIDSIPPSSRFQTSHIGVEDGLSQGSIYSIYNDSRNFMWFSSNEGLNRYDGFEIKVYQDNNIDRHSLKGNYTNGIVEDAYGNLWIGSEVCLNRYLRDADHFDFVFAQNDEGDKTNSTNYPIYADSSEVWYINSKEGILIYNFLKKTKRIISNSFFYNRSNYVINSTFRSQDGNIWMRQEIGIVRINPNTGKTLYYFSDHKDNVFGKPLKINCFFQSKDGTIRMGSKNKLIKIEKEEPFYSLVKFTEDPSTTISDIREDKNGYLWLGTEQDGLIIYKEGEGQITNFTTLSNDNLQLTNNSAGTVYIDNHENVWVNVDPEGINLIKKSFKFFKSYKADLFQPNDFASSGIRNFAERPDSKIWIVTQKDGTCLFNPETNQLERRILPDDKDLKERNESYVFIDKTQRVWVGTYSGFYYFQENDTNYKRLINPKNTDLQFSSNYIWNIKEAPDGDLIFSSEGGVFTINLQNLEIQPFFGLDKSTAQLHFDDRGNLLISEYHNGFHVLNYLEWKNNTSTLDKKKSQHFLADYNIKCFHQNHPHNDYWIGTNNGLLHIFPNEEWTAIDSLKRFTREHGLPSIYIYGILPDEQNRLWISTNRGLSSFNLKTEQFKNYVLEDGIQGYEFNTNSYLKTSTGEMYFGGTSGFNRFHPSQIKSNPSPPLSLQLTDLKINNKTNKTPGNIGEQDSIQLSFNQNTFTISYSAIDYLSNGENRYKIFLEGYDEDWQEVGAQRFVRYTGVPEGAYTFWVDACNQDGIWTEDPIHLSIKIHPPWYRSWLAYLIYFLLFGFILYTIYNYYRRREFLKNQLVQEQREAERLKEMDAFKNKIYTNISHEFRTPLTVIKGMSEKIEESQTRNLIQRNSKNLLSLVNQMLDLSKLESDSIPLHLESGDVLVFLKYQVEAFHSMAFDKQIKLTFHSTLNNFQMLFDHDKLSRIISNLIANSIKFTPKKGKISIGVSADRKTQQLKINIKDSGIGISQDQLPYIFDRFYQAEGTPHPGGTGIGLSLVKELTSLLEGNIEVQSKEGEGTIFQLVFPIKLERAATLTPTISDQPTNDSLESELAQLLIIEDNHDVVQYLSIILKPHYQITIASNGEEGIEKAIKDIPDVIISDVMMPKKDGFEVCETLKQDERTSHIPIILLTAKATSNDKLEGLSFGADAYLTKPFEKEELLIRLDQLLALRKKLQTHYSQINSNIEERITPTPQDEFLQKVKNCFFNHLSEEDYSIDDLAVEMNLSRSQLYRKIKALTNLSTSIYLRNIRLTQAKKILLEGKLSISEIAYQVGFNSPAYFSQAYKELFGYPPNKEGK